jgi:hypothetical protein
MVASAWGQSWGFSWGNAWGVVDPPAIGGGSGKAGPGRNKKIRGWERERERLRDSIVKFSPENQDGILEISKELEKSASPQANRIAKKINDYDGELHQIQSLRKEVAKLQIAIEQKKIAAQIDYEFKSELVAAARLLEILKDEDDLITIMMLDAEIEDAALLAILGIKVH